MHDRGHTAAVGSRAAIDDEALIGYRYDEEVDAPRIGDGATIRAGTIIYGDVEIGDDFSTGHHVLVREETTIGDDVLVGTNSVIDGYSTIGSHVSIQSNVYIPSHTTIGSNVFLGPNAVLTNDPVPVREEVDLVGPTIEDGVSIGANATILPGVTIGADAFVAAGAVVLDDVPPASLAVGMPADIRELPERLSGVNQLA